MPTMRTRESIAISVRIALRQSAKQGMSIDELAREVNLCGSLDLIAVLGRLKAEELVKERAGRFFIVSSSERQSI